MKKLLLILALCGASNSYAQLPKLEQPQMSRTGESLQLQQAIEKLPPAKLAKKKPPVKKAKAVECEKGGAEIGMTRKQVLNSLWGKPDSKKTKINADGTWHFWYYDEGETIFTFLGDELYDMEISD